MTVLSYTPPPLWLVAHTLAILIQCLLFNDLKVIAGEFIILSLASLIQTILVARNKLWTDSVIIKKKKISNNILRLPMTILTSIFVVLIVYTSTERIIYSLIRLTASIAN